MTLDANAVGSDEKVGPRSGQPLRYRSRWVCLVRFDCVGFELRVHGWTTSFRMSWRMGSRNTRVPLMRRNLVRSTGVRSEGGVKEVRCGRYKSRGN